MGRLDRDGTEIVYRGVLRVKPPPLSFQPTESLFAAYREPFFNTIGPKPKYLD
jgi:hypothetical protein